MYMSLLFFAILNHIIGANAEGLIVDSKCIPFDSISFHPDTQNNYQEIGWIKVISCNESTISRQINPFTIHRTDYLSLSTRAISIKFQPPGGISNPNYTNLAVIAKPYSNPIQYGLNYKGEVSFTYHQDGRIRAFSSYSNWIGSHTALARINNSCTGAWNEDILYPYDLHERIYHACWNPHGIHIWPNRNNSKHYQCVWDWEDLLGDDIEIYFGFAPECDPNIPTKMPTHSPSTNPTKDPTASPIPNPTISPTNNPTSSPTERPTKYPTKLPSFNPTGATINYSTMISTDYIVMDIMGLSTTIPDHLYNTVADEKTKQSDLWTPAFFIVNTILIFCIIMLCVVLAKIRKRRAENLNGKQIRITTDNSSKQPKDLNKSQINVQNPAAIKVNANPKPEPRIVINSEVMKAKQPTNAYIIESDGSMEGEMSYPANFTTRNSMDDIERPIEGYVIDNVQHMI